MYAVLEFLNGQERECAIVPLLWLVDNQKKCYWPKTKNEKTFKKLVKECTPYQNNWPKCSVHRLLETQADYEIARERLNHILDHGTSEDGGSTINAVTMKSTVCNAESNTSSSDRENSEVGTRKKRKHKSRRHREPKKTKKSKRNKARTESSLESSHSSDDEDRQYSNAPLDPCNNISISNSSLSCRTLAVMNGIQKEGSPLPMTPRASQILYENSIDYRTTPGRNSLQNLTESESSLVPSSSNLRPSLPITPSRDSLRNLTGNESNLVIPSSSNMRPSIQTTPRINISTQPMNNLTFQETILKALDSMNEKQDQVQLMLTQILIALETSSEPNSKPNGLPDFPLKDMNSFEAYEEMLNSEVHSKYLRNRLSSIGGTCQRSSVMSMLRLLLANNLAMNFNWAGQNKKKSFKTTTLMTVIMDAAKVQFKGKQSSDRFIIDAVQCWLKLAKSRYFYEVGKKQ